jgi:hypothetical protein
MKGPPHPWDEGLRLLPREHPLWDAETQSLRQNHLLCGYNRGDEWCVGVKGHSGEHMWDRKPQKGLKK